MRYDCQDKMLLFLVMGAMAIFFKVLISDFIKDNIFSSEFMSVTAVYAPQTKTV